MEYLGKWLLYRGKSKLTPASRLTSSDPNCPRNILSDRLRKLVEAGILETKPASDGTAYQEYVLTPQGESLFPVVVALRQWGEQHLFDPGERHSVLINKRTGKAVPPLALHDSDGTTLQPDMTEVRKLISEST